MRDNERAALVEKITDALIQFDREQYEGITGEPWPDCDHRTARIARINDAQHAAWAVLEYIAETSVGDCGNASPGNRWAMSNCESSSHCTLSFGHQGWHRDARTGTRWGKEWSDPPEYSREGQAMADAALRADRDNLRAELRYTVAGLRDFVDSENRAPSDEDAQTVWRAERALTQSYARSALPDVPVRDTEEQNETRRRHDDNCELMPPTCAMGCRCAARATEASTPSAESQPVQVREAPATIPKRPWQARDSRVLDAYGDELFLVHGVADWEQDLVAKWLVSVVNAAGETPADPNACTCRPIRGGLDVDKHCPSHGWTS